MAKTMVSEIEAAGGIMTTADFANYKPILRFSSDAPSPQVGLENMTTFYNNGRYKIVGGPPPSSGAAIGYMLNMLDRVNIRDPNMDYGLVISTLNVINIYTEISLYT
jgi:gamma-glutamyltranspeptidase